MYLRVSLVPYICIYIIICEHCMYIYMNIIYVYIFKYIFQSWVIEPLPVLLWKGQWNSLAFGKKMLIPKVSRKLTAISQTGRSRSRQPYGLLRSHVQLLKLLTDAGALLLLVPGMSILPLLHGRLLDIGPLKGRDIFRKSWGGNPPRFRRRSSKIPTQQKGRKKRQRSN